MGYPVNWAPPEPIVPHATPETERYVILMEHWENQGFTEPEWSVSDHGFTEWQHARDYLEYLSWRPGLHVDSYTDDCLSGIGRMGILDVKTGEFHSMEDVLDHGFQHVWAFVVEEKTVRYLNRERVIPVPKYIEFPVKGDGIGAILGREEGIRRRLRTYHRPDSSPAAPSPQAATRPRVTWRTR